VPDDPRLDISTHVIRPWPWLWWLCKGQLSGAGQAGYFDR